MSLSLLIGGQIALWVVIICLLLVVLGLMRQVGTLLERVSPAGMSADDAVSLKIGDEVGEQAITTLSGEPLTVGGALKSQAQFIAFVSPMCDVCKSLLPAITKLAGDGADQFTTTFAVAMGEGGDTAAYTANPNIPAIDAQHIAALLGATDLPHFAIIREDGRLAVSAPARSQREFDALVAPLTAVTERTQTHAQPLESLV